MFVRSKKVKNHKYAYLVKNKWTKKGPRQRVSKYLGRVIELKPQAEAELEELITPQNYGAFGLVKKIIGLELYNHGFTEKRPGVWVNEDIWVNLKSMQVKKSKRKVVLGLNNDFLCNFTLQRLLKFSTTSGKDEAARELATAFIQAGIPIRQDMFIRIFQMIYREGQTILQNRRMVILVSGIPGTGKTTISKRLSEYLDLEYLDVNKVIEDDNLTEGYDKEKDCRIINEDKLVASLLKRVNKSVVIDSHMSHYIPPGNADVCLITHCSLKELQRRLYERGYKKEKVEENTEAEIFDECGQEAFEKGHKIIEVNTDKEVDLKQLSGRIFS